MSTLQMFWSGVLGVALLLGAHALACYLKQRAFLKREEQMRRELERERAAWRELEERKRAARHEAALRRALEQEPVVTDWDVAVGHYPNMTQMAACPPRRPDEAN